MVGECDEKLKQRNQRNDWIYGLQRCIETVTQRYYNSMTGLETRKKSSNTQVEKGNGESEKEGEKESERSTHNRNKSVRGNCIVHLLFSKFIIKVLLY